MNRRGYLFATADRAAWRCSSSARKKRKRSAVGPARMHATRRKRYRPAPADGFEDQPTGTDVHHGPELIRRHFPYLSDETVALLHARRCGWFSGQQLGMYLLERAREKGVRLPRDASSGSIRPGAGAGGDGEHAWRAADDRHAALRQCRGAVREALARCWGWTCRSSASGMRSSRSATCWALSRGTPRC